MFFGSHGICPGKPIVRERISLDHAWKFTFGHPTDKTKDFNVGTSYFTYLAKAGYGEGAASAQYDDRTWRDVDLPHDWAVEMPFDPKGSHSHGYKAVGPGFPDVSVGWYRKTFTVPESDKGRRLSLEFDGVSRDAKVWVNGFYCGAEPSGYYGFSFDVTEFLNFGGENTIAVRADVSVEEGWYYEGAGIYRHVWLNKISPLHVPQHGTFVTTQVAGGEAIVSAQVDVYNQNLDAVTFSIINKVVDASGHVVARQEGANGKLASFTKGNFQVELNVKNPTLWSLENPYLYTLLTQLWDGDRLIDEYRTTFGIRTILFDARKGFFLNGEHVKIKGTNNHQDHAGVGCAIPDALQEWRVKQLKAMGSNAIRTSHNPPTPELLDICDRLGMLILNENRLMGISEQNLDYMRRLIVRDRNHPCVVLWSIGNEEWAIEGNEKGARIAQAMQAFARSIDDTRPMVAGVSGNWTYGISNVVEVMGYNYLRHGSPDEHHARFPDQPSLGTEEGSTHATRGIYFEDKTKQYKPAYDTNTENGFISIREGWQYYAKRDFLAGVFFWTGFDYRGEPTPYAWPSVTSYFGILDLCGFPKDNFYYLKSWWGNEPVLHILPHWNWKGREGQDIDVWVYGNCDHVELFANNKSMGKKAMEVNGYLSWKVKYVPGKLRAVGYKSGKKAMETTVVTSDIPAVLALEADRNTVVGDKNDMAVVTVRILDKKGNPVPDASLPVKFEIQGPGRVIGVGNGDPTSHEPDQFVESVSTLDFTNWKQKLVSDIDVERAIATNFDDSAWESAFAGGGLAPGSKSQLTVYRGEFNLQEAGLEGNVTWMFRSVGRNQSLYVNGQLVAKDLDDNQAQHVFALDRTMLRAGHNVVVVVAEPFVKAHPWDNINTQPGALQIIIPAVQWQRKTFSGLAQVLVQSSGGGGNIVLTAKSEGVKEATLVILAK
ncbi:MAG: beta-galactosidase GalA [Breznakibacter sp.]